MPQLIHEEISSYTMIKNVDLFGDPFTSASFRLSFAPGVLNATCDLTILQNEITVYNEEMLHRY